MDALLSSLIPTPLHPAVVHLPMALAVLIPFFAIGAMIFIARGSRPVVAWGITTALVATLALSAWASLETGEDQEEKVERIVPEAAFEAHEEAADLFLTLTVVVLGISLVGLAPRQIGTGARLIATVGTVVLLGAGWNVGHSGGALVYTHGAAAAYATPSAVGSDSSKKDEN